MGQVLIRNLDDATLVRLKALASDRGMSLEALAREALRQVVSDTPSNKRQLAEDIRSRLPAELPSSDSTAIIRWYRDTNFGREPDVFDH